MDIACLVCYSYFNTSAGKIEIYCLKNNYYIFVFIIKLFVIFYCNYVKNKIQ